MANTQLPWACWKKHGVEKNVSLKSKQIFHLSYSPPPFAHNHQQQGAYTFPFSKGGIMQRQKSLKSDREKEFACRTLKCQGSTE